MNKFKQNQTNRTGGERIAREHKRRQGRVYDRVKDYHERIKSLKKRGFDVPNADKDKGSYLNLKKRIDDR